jgi:single-strand DNA-binding protein
MAVNKVILLGNVGRDPEVHYTDTNVAVARFTLATTERGYTQGNGTVIPDKTEWHNIVLWRGLAEVAEKYVRKGGKVYIEGKIRNRSWEDKEGNKRYTTEIYGDVLELLDRRQFANDANQAPMPTEEPRRPIAPPASEEAPVKDDAPVKDLPF